MDFNSMIGQNEIKNSLRRMISTEKINHAYIFYGPKGIGKKMMAHIFAATLLCKQNQNSCACGQCHPCKMLAEGANPDLYIVKPSKSSISVDQIREMQDDIMVKPLYSDFKVYIIEEADSMTVQAQNCLLKTLEEPPSYAVVILTLANINSITETIRSRTMRLNFKKNTYDDVHDYICNRYGDIEGLHFILSYSDGVIGRAVQLLNSKEFANLRENTVKILTSICKKSGNERSSASVFFEQNKEYVNEILDIMLMCFRDMLIIRETGDENILINSDKKDIILLNAYSMTISKIIGNMDVITRTIVNLQQNANYQLSIDVMLMKLQ